MNVVIYARFSSHSQTEQSIEGQLKECYAYAQRNDYTVVGEYIDRALSGTTDHRPEFQRMIADSAKKTFQGVLVYQLDRFARNRYDSATYKSKLKKNGVRVLSARENISDDASGVLMEAVLEGMAEYYSVELAQKIKRGMDINAEKRLSTGGNLALGFKTEGKQIVVDPLTAPIVVKIFEMYVTGSTMADIIRYLNANQIKTSYGNEFNKNSINRILRNKRYIGVYTYRDKEIPDGLPRIVDEDLFWEAQRIMEKNKKAPARAKAKVDYLLTTKLFCGYCKAAMTGISGTSKTERKYHYYQCVTNRRDKSCDKKTVGKEYIEDLVVNRLRDFLTPDNISTIAKEVVDLCERESNNGNARRRQKLIEENEKATENLLKALESGQAVDIIADRITQKKKEHDELSLQLLLENSQHPTPSVKEIRFFLNQFRKGDINDPKYRQGLVDMLVNKIYLYDDKMTVLCNTQDGHFDIDLKELSSLKGQLVGLSEANSNKYRTLLELKASIDPTAIVSPPAQDGQVVTKLKQHPRYLSEKEIQEVIIRYQEGVSANKLAETYGCHKCTIRSVLRRNGITVSHSVADKKLLVEKMILLRNQGYAMKEIAKMVGINYHTVLRYFREHGATQ